MAAKKSAKSKRKRAIGMTSEQELLLRRRFPSRYWTPNRAQRRPLARWSDVDHAPRVHIITFGNRTGKTEFLGQFLTGVTKGNKWIHETTRTPFFDALNEKRLGETLTVWWVCDGELMKKGGPDYKIIKSHIPDAIFRSRSSNGVYREIAVPVLGADGKSTIECVISVKTHDMDSQSFAGDNVDIIICDEPPPQDKWAEMSGRMVNLAGDVGGRVLIGATPLKLGAFMLDLVESDDGDRVAHDEGSIWENCNGAELPEKEAERLGVEKDPKTGEYLTWGHLSREGIENAIENWKQSGDPDELPARVDGKFVHIQGRIYKSFAVDAHTCDDICPLPRAWPVIHVVDPHGARPDVAAWYAVTPREQVVCIAEYPDRPYDLITNRACTIAEECQMWRRIESELGITGQVVQRIGDPNKMNDPDKYTGKRLWELYRDEGFRFDTNVTDSLEYGHEKVRMLMYYEREKWEAFPEEPKYQPRFIVSSSCKNHIKYLRNYTRKEWKDPKKPMPTDVDMKWKEYCDNVRYMAVKLRSYAALREKINGGSHGTYDQIVGGRDPGVSQRSMTVGHRSVLYTPSVPTGAGWGGGAPNRAMSPVPKL